MWTLRGRSLAFYFRRTLALMLLSRLAAVRQSTHRFLPSVRIALRRTLLAYTRVRAPTVLPSTGEVELIAADVRTTTAPGVFFIWIVLA